MSILFKLQMLANSSIDLESPGYKTYKEGKSSIDYNPRENHIEISSIRTQTKHLKQGHAHKALTSFTDAADKAKKKIRLVSSPLNKKTSSLGLHKFYTKHGFEPTGEKVNYLGDQWYERKPK